MLQGAELALYDVVVSASARPPDASRVVAVRISDSDLDSWGWPVPDVRLAGLVGALDAAGAAAVGVDIYRAMPTSPGDASLKEAFADRRAIAVYRLGATDGIAARAPDFLAGTDRAGFSDVVPDPGGTVRRALLVVTDEDGVHESFALRLARAALGLDSLGAWPEDPTVLMFGDTPVPPIANGFGPYRRIEDSGYQIPIAFPHRPLVPSVAAGDVMSGVVPADAIAGRVAIIGIASDTIKDSFRTPIDPSNTVSPTYGMDLHGAIVDQILSYAQRRATPLTAPAPQTAAALIFAAAIFGSLAAWLSRTMLLALATGVILPLGIGGAMALQLGSGTWLPALPFGLAWLLAFFSAFAALSAQAWRQRRVVTQLFTKHISPQLFAEIWANRTTFLTGGKPVPRRLFVTILFSDLAGSTAVGGNAGAPAYMDWITRCLDALSEVATRHEGFVEKFTGDGIMVAFGAPLPHETDAEHRADATAACACALAMAGAVRRLNTAPHALGSYRVRIGLHSGEVFGGTIGSGGTLRYNIIGDAANLAARAEAFGKRHARERYDVMISMTEVTARLAADAIEARALGVLDHDDGRHQFEMFELIGLNDQALARGNHGSAER